MNYATFNHPTVKKNILVAMRNAQKWGIDHVRNKKGNAYIAVRYVEGKYSFLDSKGQDVVFPIQAAASNTPSLFKLIVENKGRSGASVWIGVDGNVYNRFV